MSCGRASSQGKHWVVLRERFVKVTVVRGIQFFFYVSNLLA